MFRSCRGSEVTSRQEAEVKFIFPARRETPTGRKEEEEEYEEEEEEERQEKERRTGLDKDSYSSLVLSCVMSF